MNDFDKYLDLQLQKMLDAVVATPAPLRRRQRPRASQPTLAVEAPIETAVEGVSALEPMVVAAPIAFPVL